MPRRVGLAKSAVCVSTDSKGFSPSVDEIVSNLVSEVADQTFDRCFQASLALYSRFRAAGFQASPIQVAGFKASVPDADPRWRSVPQCSWTHYAVEVDGNVYDLTRRQFFPDAPQAYVVPLAQFIAEWERVYHGEDGPEFDEQVDYSPALKGPF